MTETQKRPGRLLSAIRIARRALLIAAALLVAVTAASFGYNLATDGPAPRPSGLLMAHGGGFDTRYRAWGTSGTPIVLVPGAFETADTFAPLLVGHSSGAAVIGLTALHGPRYARGVLFLDGDATPLGGPSFLGWLLVNPYRTTLLRLALSQSWLIQRVYGSQCGPACLPLSPAGVETWRLPLEQPGFASEAAYSLRHGIPSMTAAQFAQLRAVPVPKRVVFGVDDPQMSAPDAAATARRIGAPPPAFVPGRHLTMISSPRQVAAAIQAFFH